MATRPLERRPGDRRTWAQPVPLRARRKRFRWLRRLLKVVLLLAILAAAGWFYLLQVYAPGLRIEARQIPALVQHQLTLQNAAYTSGSAISPDMDHAIVAIEDRRFFVHPGIDPLGMIRALWVNATNQHVDQGGSTLEQQLVKRTLVPDDRTFHGKLRSIALAWAVDQDFSKAKIIELYLNAAYYGQGAYGIDQAAHVYFGTDPAHLTLPECAFLAALPQAPSIYGANPNGAAVRQRQAKVLQDMDDLGYITPQQHSAAAAAQLTFTLPNP